LWQGAHRSLAFGKGAISDMDQRLQDTLNQLGLQLPPPLNPLGSYRTVVRSGDQLFVSGLGPFSDGKPITGRVGDEVSLAAARDAARLTLLLILACVEQECGLERIEQCLRLTVYVRAEPSFTQHPAVADGASDVLLALFGRDRLPARSAIGVHTLPMGIPVEIDSVFQLKS
jgi:enamine deaminase RidA (YjgF/YER057c/UK114 family)